MKLFARLRRPKNARGNILFRYGWKVALLLLLAGAVFAVFLFYGTWAQTFDMKSVGEMPERSTVYDVDGKIYSRLAGANRLKVSLSEVSPEFIAAVLAREDTRFYDHKGIDWRGVLRALSRDIVSMSAKEGASSLTMQLARNSLPLGGRTFSRKLLEAIVALRIEREFTKQQILELYVNRIYFGTGCYGVETASQAYFGKNAGGSDSRPESFLAVEKSPGLGKAARRGLGPHGGTEKNYAITGRAGQKNKDRHASEANATDPGELCDGRCAARLKPDPDSRPNG
jgi:membrane peptidoglycan carboxypeptidase